MHGWFCTSSGDFIMSRVVVFVACGFTLAACSGTVPGLDFLKSSPPTAALRFESVPPGAEVKVEGRAVARHASSRSRWLSFLRALRSKAISGRPSSCIPRLGEYFLPRSLRRTRCMPIFSGGWRRPSRGQDRKRRPRNPARIRRRRPTHRLYQKRHCSPATPTRADAA